MPTQSLRPSTLQSHPGSLISDSVGSGAGYRRGLRFLFGALARPEPSSLHLEADRLSGWEVTAPITRN